MSVAHTARSPAASTLLIEAVGHLIRLNVWQPGAAVVKAPGICWCQNTSVPSWESDSGGVGCYLAAGEEAAGVAGVKANVPHCSMSDQANGHRNSNVHGQHN